MTNKKCQMGALINTFERGITIKTPGIWCLQLKLFECLTCYKKINKHHFPMRKISRDKIKSVPSLLMPWPISSPAIVSRVVTRLNHVNSKFTTLYYIVNTIGRKGIGINDIGRIRIILFANRVNVNGFFFHIYRVMWGKTPIGVKRPPRFFRIWRYKSTLDNVRHFCNLWICNVCSQMYSVLPRYLSIRSGWICTHFHVSLGSNL